MTKDRDWVDYANVAANVVQTAQLGSINAKMGQLAELELQKEYREQQEGAVAKCEDLLRDAVFFYSEQLRDLEEVANQNSVTAYIRASHLKGTYERMPQFKASGFRKFEDKERLANVQRNCDRLIRESTARLSSDELDKCKRCITHMFERDDLLRLIAAQAEKERLAQDRESLPAWKSAKQAELDRAKENQHIAIPRWFKIADSLRYVSLLCCVVAAISLMIVSVRYDGKESPVVLSLLVYLLWMFPVGAMSYFVVKFSKYSRRKAEVDQHVAAIYADLAGKGYELSQRESALKKSEALYAKFGTADSAGYQTVLRERDELLAQTLGDFANGFIERKEPRGDASFSLLLVDVPSSKEMQVTIAIQESIIPNVALSDASVLIKALPRCLLHGVSRDRVDASARALEAAGAKVEIRPTA